MRKIVVFLAVVAFMSAAATAGMWWQRGDAGTTWQEWTFSTNANAATPENYYNPYGTPDASIIVSGTVHADPPGWYESFLGRSGVWHGDFASIALNIDNANITNPYKEIWVEVGFRGELLTTPLFPQYGDSYRPRVDAWLDGILISQDDVVELGRTIESAGQGWRKLIIGWRIYPNPDLEEIYLAFHDSGADLDYVIVDTVCAPEPATLMILALGSFILRKRT